MVGVGRKSMEQMPSGVIRSGMESAFWYCVDRFWGNYDKHGRGWLASLFE